MRESLIIGCLSRKSNNFKRLKGQVVKVARKFWMTCWQSLESLERVHLKMEFLRLNIKIHPSEGGSTVI